MSTDRMPSVIDHTGERRFLGNNPAPLRCNWPIYGSTPTTPLIDESKWPEYIVENPFEDDAYDPPIHDQDGVGQCNCDATVTMAEACLLILGMDYVALAAGDLYDRINGGSDRGSLLEDAMEEMMLRGVGTVKTCGTNIWYRGWKGAPAEERAKYVFLEVYLCPTFAHVFSAACMGFRVNSGIMWPTDDRLDSDGWLQPASQAGGHAIFGRHPVGRKRTTGWEFGIGSRNSWTAQWGKGGKFVIPQRYYSGPVGGWFASRVISGSPVVPQPNFK